MQRALFLAPLPGPALLLFEVQNKKLWAEDETDEHSYTLLENPLTSRFRTYNSAQESFDYPDASWRRMLVSQPPVRGYPSCFTHDSGALYAVHFECPSDAATPDDAGAELKVLTFGEIERFI